MKSANKESDFEDFYIWHPGKVNNETGERSPPSNWISRFGFSAWNWNEKRQEYYFHQYLAEQPDLNYRNPKVVESMKNVLRFWLRKGVSGFRVDAINTLFETPPDVNGNFRDEPLSGKCTDPNDFCYLDHIYTVDQNETFYMVYQWRETLEQFRTENGGDHRILMTEAYTTLENQLRYYGDGVQNGSHVPFNFYLLSNTNRSSKASDFKYLIEQYLHNIPADVEGNWVVIMIFVKIMLLSNRSFFLRYFKSMNFICN